MAFTEEEMKARWKAGIQDLDGDGNVNILDIVRAANYTQAEAAATDTEVDTSALESLASDVLSAETQTTTEASNLALEAGTATTSEESQNIQTKFSDIQSRPLPSLPSISNVGAVPFTGTVSNIPGGFQPLPQVAGGRKKLYQLSKFHGGINQKSSPRDISDAECQEAINVTFSQVGRITLLGNCLNTNAIGADISADSISAPLTGYGLFQFVAPADWDGANEGEYVFTCASNGDEVDILKQPASEGVDAGWMNFGGNDTTTNAHVFYASGNGLYLNDANFDNTSNTRKAKVYVYREDQNETVSGWKEGNALIGSPTTDNEDATPAGQVGIQNADVLSTTDGSLEVSVVPTGTGSWDEEYFFYVSWLFDGGVETGLTSIGTDTFSDGKLDLNISLTHTNAAPLGGDKRIEGGRIYFKEAGTAERWLLAEFNLADGVKGALDSTFIPWTLAGNVHDLVNHLVFDAPPSVYSYSSLNGYYANEVYTKSEDLDLDDATSGATIVGPTAHDVRYKTAVVGSGGIVFIGNVKFKGKHMSDSMMFSMPGKPGVFPQYNRFDSPSSDGSPIIALAAYRDNILQFKSNGLYIINVSNPAQFYAQASFRDCGVFNPCQVFTTSFGVIFANKNGCYIYDGQRVTSLTDGKFNWLSQSGITENSSFDNENTSNLPCIGYDPRSQSIVILKNIGDDADTTSLTNEGAWVYNMVTQSWTEGSDMITNGNNVRHTNFIISNDGYLAIKRSTDGTLLNYNHIPQGSQTITYTTKDIDFGLPSQTKKIFKVYVTYLGDGNAVTVTYGADGDITPANTMTSDESSDGTLEVAGVTDKHTVAFTLDSHPPNLKSIMFKFTGTAGSDFEINDISILYRVRPIK